MSGEADYRVDDQSGHLMLLVEVKNKSNASRDWAANLRRNIIAHGFFPSVEYFLLAVPNRFYLWKRGSNPYAIADPDFEVDPRSTLKPYFERAGIQPEAVSGKTFELIIAAWLNDLVNAPPQTEWPSEMQGWLAESGLTEAIKGGRLVEQPSA